MKRLFVIIAILFTIGCSNDKAKILSYGITKNTILTTEKNSDLIAGKVHIIDSWNLIKETDNVPNKLGIEFGIQYSIGNSFYQELVNVEEIIIFPGVGLHNPISGKSTKIDSEIVEIDKSQKQYFTYALEYLWEMKSGKWIFQVKKGDVLLLEKTFNIQ